MKRITATLAAIGTAGMLLAAPAHADTTSDAEARYWPTVCNALDQSPQTSTVLMLGAALVGTAGLSTYDAGTVLAQSVIDHCPQHIPLLRQFVNEHRAGTSI